MQQLERRPRFVVGKAATLGWIRMGCASADTPMFGTRTGLRFNTSTDLRVIVLSLDSVEEGEKKKLIPLGGAAGIWVLIYV